MPVELYGYRYSVYSWIARLGLQEKEVEWTWHEINPFEDPAPQHYLRLHPFRRVPALVHDGYELYETGAILRYIDEAFPGPGLQPTGAKARARMNQAISIVDSYAYWPLVRQVFSQGYFRPRFGRATDESEIRKGLEASPTVLQALEGLAGDHGFFVGSSLTLADIHLAPMIAYFTMDQRGAGMLAEYRKLSVWWAAMARRAALTATRPDF